MATQVQHSSLSSSGPTFSEIVYGVWNWDSISTDQADALFKTCLKHNITTFDNADIYGGYACETIFGEVYSHNAAAVPRESIQVVSKTGICLISEKRPLHEIKFYDTSKEHIIKSARNSVDVLHARYLDLFLLHRPDPLMNPQEVAEAFHFLKTNGFVKHFGVSNFTPSQFSLLSSYLPPDIQLLTNQIQLSPTYTSPLYDGTLDQLTEKRLRPMTWSPLRGLFGVNQDERSARVVAALQKIGSELGGVEEDKVALAWNLKHPSKPFPIIGTLKTDRVTKAADSTKIQLTRQQWFRILAAGEGREVP
eukprot:TRINITY_DN2062_c0_g3_i1.p1 TRINITY_DN2062_c0_g3~~TRINITY_DN2062_c0_g3_i1.p1  ORF type:complete len:307 (+),score=69.35 TRINITY_DN2062_c0_g3_i1:107-1027(+)